MFGVSSSELQSRVVCNPAKTRMVSKKVVDAILQEPQYCCSKKCINEWIQSFGPNGEKTAKTVIMTERKVHAALGKAERANHFSSRIEALLRVTYGEAVGEQASRPAGR